MPEPSTLSRRRALSLLGGGLAIGSLGGYVVGDDSERADKAASPVIAPTDWGHPNYDATNNRHPSVQNAPHDPTSLDTVWKAPMSLDGTFIPDNPVPVVANGLVIGGKYSTARSRTTFELFTTLGGESYGSFSRPGIKHTPVAAGDYLFSHYQTTDGMRLDASSFTSGERLWSWEEQTTSLPPLQPVVASGLIHMATARGSTSASAFTPRGETKWKTPFSGGTHNLVPPAATPRTLVHPTMDGFAVFDSQTGKFRWEVTSWEGGSKAMATAPVLHDGAIYTARHDGRVLSYDLEDDSGPRWVRRRQGTARIAAVADGYVYLTRSGVKLEAHRADDGSREWSLDCLDIHPDASGLTAATLCDGSLYVGVSVEDDDQYQHRLSVVDADDGAVSHQTTLPGAPRFGPMISNGTVIVQTRDGFVGLR
ncbi:outer membrane protein assembly factor BamB family protein [Haloferax larsenii]|uniref:Outer membrane protein assembly factor BamB n=1 Tax=Haloferax larsenii TaxID=302484 RepID=A0A1H7UY76_HALLR|nr:PQQ-binding-like beta-propeller repeat protein [Haloferax larsenii]SEM01922.1 outer membrane protein assembly factor BamB [Haloferax larsenii]